MHHDMPGGTMKALLFASAALAGAAGLTLVSGQEMTPAGPGPARFAVGSAQRDELRQLDSQLDRMARTGEMKRRIVRQDTVLPGRSHERFDQYFRGVRVVGGDVVRQSHEGMTESIFGTVHDGISISTNPTIDEERALQLFTGLAGRDLPAGRRPELVVLPKDEGGYALTWRMHIWTGEGLMHTFLDARTGAVVRQYNDLQTQAAVGTGVGVLGDTKKISTRASAGAFLADDEMRPPTIVTYDMKGNLGRTILVLFYGFPLNVSEIASDSDNHWTDAVAVDAHVHMGWTYDFLVERFGRRGLDDGDAIVRAITHPVRLSDAFNASPDELGTYFAGAFWCPDCHPDGRGLMLLGEGIPAGYRWGGRSWKPLAGALDAVSHEMAHGLTMYSSNLTYLNESGALNESFSDVIATSVEFFYHPDGQGLRKADYLIGEDVATPSLRSMADPEAYGDPDHYSRRERGSADHGGVHTNSGIPNHAFYLAIEGGTNRTSGITVEGVGAANRAQIEKVFYRAFVYLLTSDSNFAAARAATIQSARELYGVNSPAERAVTQAWTAVGVN